MFTIRPATLADLDPVYQLICDLEGKALNLTFFTQNYKANLQDSTIRYIVACDGEKAIGFLSMHIQRILHHERPTCELQELNVLPEYRSLGVGSMLMGYAEEFAKELGLEEVELTTRNYRLRTQEFYKRLGYKQTHIKFVKKL